MATDIYDGIYKDTTYKIIGGAMEVHNKLGPGFPENIYQNAFEKELQIIHIKYESQKNYKVKYKDKFVGIFRADLVV